MKWRVAFGIAVVVTLAIFHRPVEQAVSNSFSLLLNSPPPPDVILDAIQKGDLVQLQNIFKNPRVKTDMDLKGQTPLHAAIRANQLEIFNYLISRKADINKQNEQLMTPMQLAWNLRRYNIYRRLEELGAAFPKESMSFQKSQKDLMLDFIVAASKSDWDAALWIVDVEKFDIRTLNEDGTSAIYYVLAQKGPSAPTAQAALLRLLLDHGADPNTAISFKNETPVFFLLLAQSDENASLLFQELKKYSLDINKRDFCGRTMTQLLNNNLRFKNLLQQFLSAGGTADPGPFSSKEGCGLYANLERLFAINP